MHTSPIYTDIIFIFHKEMNAHIDSRTFVIAMAS